MLEKFSKISTSFLSVQALIDLQALKNNYVSLKKLALEKNPHAKTLAVIKADAYGHGMLPVARALSQSDVHIDFPADGFAVARIEEALLLRQSGLKNKIVLLEGVFSFEALKIALDNKIDLVFHSHGQVVLLEKLPKLTSNAVTGCWIKVNTGMNRLGFALADLKNVLQVFEKTKVLKPEVLMTHLASADADDSQSVYLALEKFSRAKTLCPDIKQFSIANSAALMAYPESRADWNRPGISLYGSSLLKKPDIDLQQVMTLSSKVLVIHKVAAGEAVGYGGIWRAQHDTHIAVIGIGYGDGYPRHARNGTPVLIAGKEYPLAGRVSMDMITVDIGLQHGIKVGDTAVLWGYDDKGVLLSADRIASYADTISYQLFCGITSRVEKVYING